MAPVAACNAPGSPPLFRCTRHRMLISQEHHRLRLFLPLIYLYADPHTISAACRDGRGKRSFELVPEHSLTPVDGNGP